MCVCVCVCVGGGGGGGGDRRSARSGHSNIMKSTKVQNPRCIPRIKPIMRAYWPPIAVQLLPGQNSLLRRL